MIQLLGTIITAIIISEYYHYHNQLVSLLLESLLFVVSNYFSYKSHNNFLDELQPLQVSFLEMKYLSPYELFLLLR